MYKSKDIGIVIATNNNLNNIRAIILSIKKSRSKPGQVIIVSNEYMNFISNEKYIKIIKSNYKNQVWQRNYGIKFLNNKIKILLQLDDKYILDSYCLDSLLKTWNKTSHLIYGVGLRIRNNNNNNKNLLNFITLTRSNNDGEILKSGFNNNYDFIKKNVSWLKGGASSWKLEKVKFYLKRNYPLISWSVYEDVFFSYFIKKKYNGKLIISNNSFLKKSESIKYNDDYIYTFEKGFLYSKLIKSFVFRFKKDFSLLKCYYAVLTSSIIGLIYSIFTFKLNKSLFYIARVVGIFSKKYNINF